MADTDNSSPIVRYNLVQNRLEYFNGADWYPAVASGSSGITQLTGAVTAGPGSGSQAANVNYIVGVTDGSNAATGNVGEYMESTFSGSSFGAGSGAYEDFASLALTAGDWDLVFQANGNEGDSTTVTRFDIAISPNPGNDTTGLVEGQNQLILIPLGGAVLGEQPLTLARVRTNITTTTTYYAKVSFMFTGSNPAVGGILSARRMR